MERRSGILAISIFLLWTAPAISGSFVDVVDCTSTAGCSRHLPATPNSQCTDCEVTPFAIVHPLGCDGTQTALTLRICLDDSLPEAEPALQWAIDIWEGLTPVEENCHGCVTWEEGGRSGRNLIVTTILHELGHCAMGLDHPNRHWDDDWNGVFEETSFTRSADVANTAGAISAGTDMIRGSQDDQHTAPAGGDALSVSWFRTVDNDPFVIDATVIDLDSYTNARSQLPSGHNWGTNANRVVGDDLGYSDDQSVMYSGTTTVRISSFTGSLLTTQTWYSWLVLA